MRTSLLLSFLFGVACLVTEHAEASLRAIPLTSARRELQTLPYAFFVSEIRKANGDPWCMTAINGVNDGNFLGFDLCDFVFPRDDRYDNRRQARGTNEKANGGGDVCQTLITFLLSRQ
jgi:hypothetical protein